MNKEKDIRKKAKEAVDNMKFEELIDYYMFQKGKKNGWNSALKKVKEGLMTMIFVGTDYDKHIKSKIKDRIEGLMK